jgi:hypothetical protein
MAMGATVHPSLVSLIVRQLPRPLLSALDAWSHRVARRRAAERQRKWAQRRPARENLRQASRTS